MANAGNENVREAIIVIVPHSHAHTVEFDIETRVRRDIRERTIAVVMVKAQRGAIFFVARPVGTVNEQNILPAVAVVVQKSAAGAERLRQEFSAEGPTVVLELNSGLAGHIREPKTRRSG